MCLQALLYEVTYKQLRAKVDTRTRLRSKRLVTELVSVSKNGVVTFDTISGTNPPKKWRQKVKLLDLEWALKRKVRVKRLRKPLPRVRKALRGDILVDCDCPAFPYWGWAYITSKIGAKYGIQERRYPKIRNPRLRGSVCKHLDNALMVLPALSTSITKRIKEAL